MLGSSILSVFARSPLKPMQQHMGVVFKCINYLPEFFEYVFNNEWDKAEKIHLKIMQSESTADDIKRKIRLNLPSSLFLPVSRSDLLALLTSQDKIASKAKHISSLIFSRKMLIPDILREDLLSLLLSSINAAKIASDAINSLDNLVAAGFKGQEVSRVESLLIELDDIEQIVDQKQVLLREKTFAIEDDLPAVHVVFLYKIIDWSAELADRSQHVGNRLESIVAHY